MMKRILLSLIMVLAILQGRSEDIQPPSVKAVVVDDKNGETLVGATVVVDGTTQGTTTDLDGVASLNLTPGVYNIRVSYVSYQTVLIQGVTIKNNKTAVLNVRLVPANLKLNEVVVTAKALRNNEAAVLTMQKKSAKLFDALSSDQFGKVGASDAASALKRVTGVTVSGGKYVYVRGLGDRYSKTTLNGSEVPSLDPNKNAVQLDIFPSNLIDNIKVYKTFSPDLQGDFAGGLVDITTNDFPDKFQLKISAGLGYNDQATFNSEFLHAKGSPTDFLGFDNGFRALPAEIAKYNSADFPDPYLNKTAITEVSRAFTNSQFNPGKQAPFFNHDMSFSVGNQVDLFKRPLGFVVGLTYNRSFKFYDNGIENVYEGISQGQQTLNNDILTTSRETKSSNNVLIGALFNSSYKINKYNKIGLSVMGNQDGTSEARYLVGYLLDANPDSSTHVQNRVINYMQRSFVNGQLRGEHLVKGLHNLNIKWMNSFTSSTIDQPDLRMIRNTFIINNQGDSLFYLGNQDRPSRFFRHLSEINENAKVDFTLPLPKDTKLKFGGLFTYKKRVFHESIYQYYIQNSNFDGNVQVFFEDQNLGYVDGVLKNFLMLINIDPNNYDAFERLYASYAMIETSLSENVKLIAGVRFEKTHLHLKAQNDSVGNIQTNDFLPALALIYHINEKTNLRFSATRTLARPSFREFSPLATYDFFGGYIQNGNPKLKRTLINNLDLRWEKYPAPGEYISFSLFYKDFINPIENAQLPRAGGSASQFQYKNVARSSLYGAEVELRKNLGDWFPVLKNFKLSTNFSYVYAYVKVTPEELEAIKAWNSNPKSTRPMYNQAPYSLNAMLTYADDNWESALSFNVSGKRLVVYQIDLPSIYLQPMPDLNFTIKRNISKRFYVRFKATNLLNAAHKEQIDLANRVYYTTKYQNGRTYSFSLTYKIN
ncbi:MAG: TonB-dependent receptor [Bacteroidales bacterium]|nr:TonB-dependent receptor [Bacteroidales bacterium]